jgi:hypothetical protein
MYICCGRGSLARIVWIGHFHPKNAYRRLPLARIVWIGHYFAAGAEALWYTGFQRG